MDATMTGCTLLHANRNGTGALKTYLCVYKVAAYTGASDDITITAVGATIAALTRNGKTNTVKGAICVEPGLDTAAQAVYLTGTATWAMVVSADTLVGHLASVSAAEVTSATASEGIALAVTVVES